MTYCRSFAFAYRRISKWFFCTKSIDIRHPHHIIIQTKLCRKSMCKLENYCDSAVITHWSKLIFQLILEYSYICWIVDWWTSQTKHWHKCKKQMPTICVHDSWINKFMKDIAWRLLCWKYSSNMNKKNHWIKFRAYDTSIFMLNAKQHRIHINS